MAEKKKNKSKSAEKVCETFEIKKKGEESKEKTLCGIVEKKHSSKEEIKHQEKTLRNILIGLAVIVLFIIVVILLIRYSKHFEYRGITGDAVKEGNLLFYSVVFPYNHNGKMTTWTIYIRNNPRKLDKIPFEGEMDFGWKFNDGLYRLVLNMSDNFYECEDASISIGNMINLQALGVKVMKDENATCDEQGRYMYINIKKGEKTEIVQVGNACYNIIVKDCDILKATERFMVEMFVKYYSK